MQWPKEGIFRERQCEKVKEMLTDWIVGKEDYQTRGKRIKWLEVLSWFEEEGKGMMKREEAIQKEEEEKK